jgi:hypothetical protein
MRKGAINTIPSQLSDPWVLPSFPPLIAIEVVEKVKHLLMNRLPRFTGPIYPACDQYIQ